MTLLLVARHVTGFDEALVASLETAFKVLFPGVGLQSRDTMQMVVNGRITHLLVIGHVAHGHGFVVAVWPIAHEWLDTSELADAEGGAHDSP